MLYNKALKNRSPVGLVHTVLYSRALKNRSLVELGHIALYSRALRNRAQLAVELEQIGRVPIVE